MSSGNGARPHWSLALAGIQAGVVGALILLGYLALDSAWHRHSVWTVPNLLASTFYGESAYRQGFSAGTSVGVALLLLLYGALGLLFALVIRDHGTRMRVVLAGLIYGTGWFFLSFDILWKHVNPMVQIYSPTAPCWWDTSFTEACWAGAFRPTLQSISRRETPAALELPSNCRHQGSKAPTAT